MRRFVPLTLILALVLGFQSLLAQSIVVTSTADSGPGSLRNAVASAGSGAAITFDAALAGSTITLSSPITVPVNMTIQGLGPDQLTISGGGTSSMFLVNTPIAWNITDIRLEDGFADVGGAINQFGGGGFATFQNVAFVNNEANGTGGFGGALRTKDFFTFIIGCSFEGNRSLKTVGDLAGQGGAVFKEGDGLLIISRSFFSANEAVSGNGGALAIPSSNSFFSIDNSTFTLNEAKFGGAMYCARPAGSAIQRSTIYDNHAGEAGGGIWLQFGGSSITFQGNILAGNTDGIGARDVFAPLSAINNGGYNMVQDPNIASGATWPSQPSDLIGTAPTFFGETGSGINKALGLDDCSQGINAGNPTDTTSDQLGQAIFGGRRDMGAYEAQVPFSPPPLVVSSLADEGCGTLRNAIAAAPSGSTITFDPALNGQTISLESEIIINKNLTIQGPGADLLTVENTTVERHFYVAAGSGTTYTFVVSDLRLVNGRSLNTAEVSTGLDPGTGGSIHAEFGNLEVYRCVFADNEAIDNDAINGFGGAIRGALSGGSLIMEDCRFANNTAISGGAVATAPASTLIQGCAFSGNLAGNAGGAIFGSCNIERCTFYENTCVIDGGAIWGSDITMDAVSAKGNSAVAGGGGFWYYDGVAPGQINHVALDSNTAPIGPNIYNPLASSSLSSGGYNLIQDPADAFLTLLATDLSGVSAEFKTFGFYEGSLTQVLPLGCGSPAIHGGNPADMGALDQLGRPQIGPRDIGAFEQPLYPVEGLFGSNGQSGLTMEWDPFCSNTAITPNNDPDGFAIYLDGDLSPTGTTVGTALSFTVPTPSRSADFIAYCVASTKGSAESDQVCAFGRTAATPSNQITGNVFTGTLVGIPDVQVCATPQIPEWGLLLNGSGQSVQTGESVALGASGSLSLWLRADDWTPAVQRGVFSNTPFVANGQVTLALQSTGQFVLTFTDAAGSGTASLSHTPSGWTDSSWHHLAFTWEPEGPDTRLRLWLDEQEAASITTPFNVTGTDMPFYLGRDDSNTFWAGAIDEFQYHTVALDSTTWKRRSATIPLMDDAGLSLYYRFENLALSGEIILQDYAKSGQNNGQLVGGASLGAAAGYPVGHCAVTNPSGDYVIREAVFNRGGTLRTFDVKPTTPNRFYDPNALSASDADRSGKNFKDTTVFVIEGTVVFPTSGILGDCAVDSVLISIVGTTGASVQPVYTQPDGTYAIAVPEPGNWTITPSKDDHVFEPATRMYDVQDDIIQADFADVLKRELYGEFRGACITSAAGAPIERNIFTDSVQVQVSSIGSEPLGCFDTTFTTTTSNAWLLQVPPQQYRVTILNAYVGGVPDTDIAAGLLIQGMQEMDIDLRDTTADARFVYREQPTLDVGAFGEWQFNFDACGGTKLDSFILVQQLDDYMIPMQVTQRFTYLGSETVCPLLPADTGKIVIGDPISGFVGELALDSAGSVLYPMEALNVNTTPGSATPEFSWAFNATAVIDALDPSSVVLPVVVAGYNSSGSNFITKSPQLPVMILRDPPGDASFSTLRSTGSRCYERTVALQTGTDASEFDVIYSGESLNAGVSVLGVTASKNLSIWSNLTSEYNMASQNISNTRSRICVDRLTEYSTSGAENFVGRDADVFIGATFVQTFSIARDLQYSESQCKLVLDTAIAFANDSILSTYLFTRAGIENNQIPNLEALLATQPLSVDTLGNTVYTDSARIWLTQIDVWEQVLALSDSLSAVALAGETENFSLSGGASISQSVTKSTTGNNSISYNVSFSESFLLEAGTKFAGLGFNDGRRIRESFSVGNETETSLDTATAVSFHLEDNDIGDSYSFDVGTDPIYGTNVYSQPVGQTSCPHEEGTVKRDNGQFNVPANFAFVPLPWPTPVVADFPLTISNTSFSLSDSTRSFIVDLIRNPDGAIVRVDGSDIGTGVANVDVPTIAPYSTTLTVEKGSTAFEYQDITVGLFPAACPEDGALAEVTVQVQFESPCPDATLFAPNDGWVVNLATGNDLQFTLGDFDASSINSVVFEKRLVGLESNFSTLFSISGSSLLGAGAFWDTLFNASSLVEGTYDVRAKVVCAGGYTVTDINRGTINRTALQAIATVPPNGGTLGFGEIPSATFNEDIFCGVVGPDNAAAYFSADSVLIGLEDPICGGPTVTLPLRTSITSECEYENRWVTYTLDDLVDLFGNPIQTTTWSFYVDRFADPLLSLLGTEPSLIGGSDGSIDLSVSGGFPPYSYSWSTGATSEDISGLAAGTYVVTVEDAQCSSVTDSITIEDPTTPPAPPNDLCGNAINVAPGSYTVSTVGATGSDISSCGVNDTASIWYFYIPTRSGTAIISTCGSDFDPVIAVRRQCVGGPEFGCNDNDVANLRCGGTEAALQLTVSAGVGAYIRLSGANGSVGNTTLSIEEPGMFTGTDACVDADTVGTGSYAVSTVGATGSDISSCGVNDTASVWFYYVPTQSGTAIVSTCGSGFDPVITVRLNCVGGPELGCNDNDVVNLRCGGAESAIELPVNAGVGAYIRISGANGSVGTTTLTIEEPSSGCSSATPPQNPSHIVEANRIRLQWDPVSESVACEVRGERILPSTINGKATINAFEAFETTVPFTALGNATTWRFRVRCACSISPVDATAYSSYDTFSVPVLNRENVGLPRSAKVFPNPVSKVLFLDLQGYASQTVDLQISSMDGRVHYVERRDIGLNWEMLDLPVANLAPGLYNVSILTEDGVESRRFHKAGE